MRRIRALISQSPAVVISVTALVFALAGGATAAEAHLGAVSETRVHWYALKPLTGWAGSPKYGISGDGVVYLSGEVRANQRIHGGVFAVLPTGVRLWHAVHLFIIAGFNGDAVARFAIQPNGDMVLTPAGSQPLVAASLDGLALPVTE